MIEARKRIVKYIQIDPNSGCWIWTGCVQSNGYGRVTYKYKTMGAHRLAYMAFNGDIPKKHDVCHSCDNRRCVNPAHLFTGTRKDNMQDAVQKNRQAKGESLPHSKLSDLQRLEVIEKIKAGALYKDIAKEYGVTRHAIGHIGIVNNLRRNNKNVNK